MKKRFSTMQRSGVLKRIFTCVIALALAMPMTVQTGWAATTSYTVTVADGYLALRNAKAYDDKNEIGKLYTGDTCLLYTSNSSSCLKIASTELADQFVGRVIVTDCDHTGEERFQSTFIIG